MPADPDNAIPGKLEAAFVAFVAAAFTEADGVQVHTGSPREKVTRTAVFCQAGKFSEHPDVKGSGIYAGKFIVTVESAVGKEDEADDHDIRVGVVMDRLRQSDLLTQLNDDAYHLHFYDVSFFGEGDPTVDSEKRIHRFEQTLDIVFMPSEL